jgi:hypothetical protein
MTTAFSEEQEVELSKIFESRIRSAAASRSAVSSMITGTLPARRDRSAGGSCADPARADHEGLDRGADEGLRPRRGRPLTAIIALLTGVAPGLVEGVTAPITPIGLAYLTSPFASSRSITPTDGARRRSRALQS